MSPPPDVLPPSGAREGYRRIIAAREALAAAELLEAVRAVRKAGDSWTVIGAALGQSRQAAHRKYAHCWTRRKARAK